MQPLSVVDNKAFRTLVHCFARTLNLAVKEAIRKPEDIFECKTIVKESVTFFNHSAVACGKPQKCLPNSVLTT